MEHPPDVSDELIRELHQANELFHAARAGLEQAMESSDYRHQERIDAAEAELRQAERAVEAVEERIRQSLAAMPPNLTSPSSSARQPRKSP
jgi:hypothetical protein